MLKTTRWRWSLNLGGDGPPIMRCAFLPPHGAPDGPLAFRLQRKDESSRLIEPFPVAGGCGVWEGRTPLSRHSRLAAGAGLLPAGGAGAALVSRRHPAGPAGRRQPDWPIDGLPVSARGHRRPRRGGADSVVVASDREATLLVWEVYSYIGACRVVMVRLVST